MVEVHTGMNLDGKHVVRLREAVDRMVSEDAFSGDLEEVLSESNRRNLLLEQLTARMTVGETFFFRNEHHMRALTDHVLPQILRDNADKRDQSEIKARHGLPVILVTTLASEDHRRQGLQAGADAYLVESTLQDEGLTEIIRQLV